MKGCGCLLWADTVADGFELVGAGDAGYLGDVALGQAHHVFRECRVKAWVALRVELGGCGGGAGQSLPPSNSGGVGPPVDIFVMTVTRSSPPDFLLPFRA